MQYISDFYKLVLIYYLAKFFFARAVYIGNKNRAVLHVQKCIFIFSSLIR